MKRKGWIGFVATRYVSMGRKNSPSPIFSILGIATGVLALTVIIAVMNGFQMGFIDSILEISSYHLRLEGLSRDEFAQTSEEINSLREVSSVLPFRELNVLLRSRQSNPRGALVRGVPQDALSRDPGLEASLVIEDGSFDLSDRFNILLGAELARHLFVEVGDELNLLSISGGLGDGAGEGEDQRAYRVTGIFRSGFYEYDLGWGFVSMETAEALSGEGASESPVLGIKLRNRWQDRRAMEEIAIALSGKEELSLTSWRDYNRAFFSALRTEKLLMFFLVGLIFIVVGLNIFQAQRRIVLERGEEIGLLRALGASDTEVRLVFVWDGCIIGFTGASLGLGLGLLTALNIEVFFTFLEGVVNFFIHLVNEVLSLFGVAASSGEFSVFSPQIFYLREIPSRVIPYEAAMIFLFGFLSALLAAWFASGKVSGTSPAEVLRYE